MLSYQLRTYCNCNELDIIIIHIVKEKKQIKSFQQQEIKIKNIQMKQQQKNEIEMINGFYLNTTVGV